MEVTSSNRKSSALTGSCRKIKDNAADWHNLLLRWERVNENAATGAANIVNIRRSQSDQLTDESSPQTDAETQIHGGATEPQTDSAPSLTEECNKLQDAVDKMVVMVRKMERLVMSQRGVQELEEFQFGTEGRKVPLFLTWDTQDFTVSCSQLLSSFQQELKLKQLILSELAHTMSPDLCLVYLSAWLHQPYIHPNTRLSLEALLLETGHRTL